MNKILAIQYIKRVLYLSFLLAACVYAVYAVFVKSRYDVGPLHPHNLCAWSKSFGLTLQTIKISGTKKLSKERILSALNIPGKSPIFYIDLHMIRTKVRNLSWVQDASVHRDIARKSLHIKVHEYAPFCLWKHKDTWALVSECGTILDQTPNHSLYAKLPRVQGDNAPRNLKKLYTALYTAPFIQKKVVLCDFISQRRWNIHLDNGVVILLPEKNIKKALARLIKLLSKRINLLDTVSRIDLRVPDRVTLRHRGGKGA